MITLSRPLRFSSIRSVQNARTRVFAAGSDPVFSRTVSRLAPVHTEVPSSRVFDPQLLDRLTPPLTRFHD